MTVPDIDLHAYVDGELSIWGSLSIANKMQHAEKLCHEIDDIQALKQLILLAYRAVPTPASARQTVLSVPSRDLI